MLVYYRVIKYIRNVLNYIYRIRGKFRWAKLSRYSHYMDFPVNTFAVQGYVAI